MFLSILAGSALSLDSEQGGVKYLIVQKSLVSRIYLLITEVTVFHSPRERLKTAHPVMPIYRREPYFFY